jgi:hypothetical protein
MAEAESASDAMAEMAAREGLSHDGYLLAFSQVEAAERPERRVQRLMSESRLPRGKTLATFDLERLPAKARTQVAGLRDGAFRERAVNVIAPSLPHYLLAQATAGIASSITPSSSSFQIPSLDSPRFRGEVTG